MKIINLQSVGLGALLSNENTELYTVKVGENLHAGHDYGLDIIVTEINHVRPLNTFEYYEVKTSDRHVRLLPADKYISEWSE